MTTPKPSATTAVRTPKEQALLDAHAKTESPAWVEQHAGVILAQAQMLGDL